MTVLIIGYPDSGKSELAEQMATDMSAPGERIYFATMIPYGDEGAARVEKHRKMREGKGFITIEAPFDILMPFEEDESTAGSDESDKNMHAAWKSMTVLLECLSNLVANELFERHTEPDALEDKIVEEMTALSEKVGNIIIVSNHFETESGFDAGTRLYASVMDEINDRLGGIADKVIRL